VTNRRARWAAVAWAGACLGMGAVAQAAVINLGALRCDAYQKDILNASATAPAEDALNLVMWLYGFAVAKSGAHAIYTDGLQAFGNALDLECKTHPATSVLDAVLTVRPSSPNALDLSGVACGGYERRHADLEKTDPESAKTLMMWLFGFAVGKAGGHSVDSAAVGDFAQRLAAECTLHPDGKLYESLTAVKWPKLRQ